MTDGDHLYRAILCDPADDTLRLAYADWLDETAGTEECTRCKGRRVVGWDYVNGVGEPPKEYPCPECTAPGYEPEFDGNAARAEFIRVQCRLATPCVTCTPVCSQEYGHAPPCELGLVGDLRRREHRLFDRHAHLDWFPFPGFQAALSSEPPTVARGSWLVVERGFVSEVRLPAAAFLGEVCAFCEGRGHFQSSGSYAECPRCRGPLGTGTGRTPGLAKALFAAHPITKVVLTNKSPEETPSGWSWFDHGFADDSATITPDLFRHLSDTDGAQPGLLSARMTFATREAALDALSVALVAYGRRAAMLSD
jgi:uncharacterized protein (TIGR02996 family)